MRAHQIHAVTSGGKAKFLARRFWLTALLCVLACVTLYQIRRSEAARKAAAVAPAITVNKTAALANDANGNGFVNPGDKLAYSVTVNNNGSDALNVVFSDQLDANLSLEAGSVKASPIAANDSYSVIGNVGITVSAANGVLVNDINPQGTGTLTAAAASGASAQGGSFALNADGSFSYNPPVGYEGADSFSYTLNHSNGKSDTSGTVNLTVSGMLWFVNNNAGACAANCNGRLSNPFTSLAAFNTANALSGGLNPDNNDNIFVYESATQYSGAVTLRTGQKLLGQDATASLDTIAGINLASFPFSNALPALNSANAAITNLGSTVTLNTNATVRGLQINAATSTGINDPGSTLTGISVSEVSVATTTGTAVLLSNTGGTLSFKSISANGAANGISLTGTTGSFTVSGDGTNNASGGTIQNTTGNGVLLSGAQNVALTSMSIQNTTGSGVKGSNNCVNFSFVNGTINNSNDDGTAAIDESNIAFNAQSVGTEKNLSGTVTITGSTLTNALFHGIDIFNFDGTFSDVNISNNTLTSATTTIASQGSGIRLVAFGSATTVANITKATLSNNTINRFPIGSGILLNCGNANTSGTGGSCGTPGSGVNVITITGNHIAGQASPNQMGSNAIAVALTGGNPASRSQANFDLSNNGTVANPLTNFKGSGVACSIFGSSTGVCNVTNNVMVANNTLASRCIAVGVDRTIGASDAPDITATISNNSVSGCDGNGIFTGALNSNGTAKIKVSNNTIAAPLTGVRPGIQVNSGTPSAAGTNTTVCLNISGNTSAGSGGTNGIGLRKEGTVSTTNAFGVQGMAATASPGIETFINGLNPAGNGTLLTSATSGFTNCSSAPAIAPPVDAEQPNANAAASGLLTRAWQWIASFFAA